MKTRSGFTMIELIVAISIFIVVTTISAGGFIRSLRSQRAVFALISANSNSSLTVEQMSREIRTGYNFCSGGLLCNESAFPGGSISDDLVFVNEQNEIVTYALQDGLITRKTGLGIANAITADNVDIRNLRFVLRGNQTGDEEGAADGQTRITILFTAGATGRDVENIAFDFQTTVSPRVLDTFSTPAF